MRPNHPDLASSNTAQQHKIHPTPFFLSSDKNGQKKKNQKKQKSNCSLCQETCSIISIRFHRRNRLCCWNLHTDDCFTSVGSLSYMHILIRISTMVFTWPREGLPYTIENMLDYTPQYVERSVSMLFHRGFDLINCNSLYIVLLFLCTYSTWIPLAIHSHTTKAAFCCLPLLFLFFRAYQLAQLCQISIVNR